MVHMIEILPETSGTDELGLLHDRELQDLIFIRSLPSRTGDVVDFPNTDTDTEN